MRLRLTRLGSRPLRGNASRLRRSLVVPLLIRFPLTLIHLIVDDGAAERTQCAADHRSFSGMAGVASDDRSGCCADSPTHGGPFLRGRASAQRQTDPDYKQYHFFHFSSIPFCALTPHTTSRFRFCFLLLDYASGYGIFYL